MIHQELMSYQLSECIIFDIETSSHFDGKPINLRTDNKLYVEHAIVKWVGCYSYKHKQYMMFNAMIDADEIKEVFADHKYIVGFNSEEFDKPIMVNNGFINKYKKNMDVMLIMGNIKYKKGFKRRAEYMGIDLQEIVVNGKVFGGNSLQGMAAHFKIDTLKGDIDYAIFHKTSWNDEETKDILKYLKADVELTKNLFDKLLKFWPIFTDWLSHEDVEKWAWIKSSIASLTYVAACKVKGVPATFSSVKEKSEKMGGRAVEPVQEETTGVHYIDEVSKYPHIFSEFNLFSEIDVTGRDPKLIQHLVDTGKLFHGNDMFKVKGYYDIRKHGVLEIDIVKKLKTRFAIKRALKSYYETPEEIINEPLLKDLIPSGKINEETASMLDGLQYAIKIFANSLYGVARSSIFENIYTENCGWDCCWIGQQIHEYVHRFFEKRGFKVVGGFTDSWFIEDKNTSGEEIAKLSKECMDEMKKFMPFPQETHQIDYECYVDYILYNYDEKTRKYKKNNYAFISEGKVKIVGFPIKKSNASKLGILIFKKYLEKQCIDNKSMKFDRSYIEGLIKQELANDITLAAVKYRCNDAESYKNTNQLQAQISRAYLDGLSGSVDVIKNKKFGGVGITEKHCNVNESDRLCYDDLILTKVWNELQPFLKTQSVGLGAWF